MAFIEFHTTDSLRVCKICNCPMTPWTWGVVMREVHVPPKVRDIHFHEGCFMRTLDTANAERNKTTTNDKEA